MALLTGKYKNVAEAQIASNELEQAGIARNAIRMAPAGDSKIELSVSTDAGHAEAALRIMKIHGSVDTRHHLSNWAPRPSATPADQVSGDRRYVTENRDTSREPQEDRDDVQLITDAVDRDHARLPARLYEKPK